MVEIEVVDVNVACFSQAEVHAVDDVFQIEIVFGESSIEKTELGGIEAADVVGGSRLMTGGGYQCGFGGGGVDGVTGGIPPGIGG